MVGEAQGTNLSLGENFHRERLVDIFEAVQPDDPEGSFADCCDHVEAIRTCVAHDLQKPGGQTGNMMHLSTPSSDSERKRAGSERWPPAP